MKKSLSAPNLPQLAMAPPTPKSKVNTKMDVRTQALPLPINMPMADFIANVVSAESAYHVSFKVAHECALQYPEFVLHGDQPDNISEQEGLALCLATPDDTIIPRNLDAEGAGSVNYPRLRRKTKSANFLG